MSRPFVLCADDYGLAPGVSRAILDLIDRGRLSATGCMTTSPFWPEHAAWLRAREAAADIGLHLTLTDQVPLGPMPRTAPDGRLPPLGRLMPLALARRLDRAEIEAEIGRQLDAFAQAFGRPPDFVDGHQHVHQLPVIREALAARLAALGARERGIYVRVCTEPAHRILRRGVQVPKALLISALGRGWAAAVGRSGLARNRGFSGVHDFSGKVPFGRLMARFLDGLPAGGLVMCHPGIPDDALRAVDPVVEARQEEYDWLGGLGLPALLAGRDRRLARFGACGPAPGEEGASRQRPR